MAEKLELVTTLRQLRVGMKVVMKTCVWCGCDHELFLLRSDCGEMIGSDGSRASSVFWHVLPELHEDDTSGPLILSSRAIAERRVYKVIDGLEQSTEARKSVTA